MEWLINQKNRMFYGMKLPTGFQLIGQTTLKQYQDLDVHLEMRNRFRKWYREQREEG